MGAAARIRASEFDLNGMVDKVLALYGDVLRET
jgi:hypothetical protein